MAAIAICFQVVLVVLGQQVAATQPPAARPERALKRSEDGAVYRSGWSYRSFSCMPAPIKASDVARWTWRLGLSPAQEGVFRHLHAQYQVEEEKVHFEHVQPLWDAIAIPSDYAGPPSPTALREQARLTETGVPVAIEHVRKVEARLFDALQPILSEEQSLALPWIRAERIRSAVTREFARYPGADVDLAVLAWNVATEGFELSEIQAERLRAILGEYDAAAAEPTNERRTAIIELSTTGTSILADRIERVGDAFALSQQAKDLQRSLLLTEKRITNLNVEYVTRLATELACPFTAEMHRRLEAIQFRPLRPDPYDLSELFSVIKNDATFIGKPLESLHALEADFVSQHGAIDTAMKSRWLRWKEHHAVEWSFRESVIGPYREDITALHRSRVELVNRTLDSIVAVLGTPDEVPKEVQQAIEATRQRIAKYVFQPEPGHPTGGL